MVSTALDILADENIPYVQEAFADLGTVTVKPGREIRPADAREVDLLLVRSVTRVDASLLAGSRVQFVGSATIGTDHIDLSYLGKRGIIFTNAPGSNAESVAEYVAAAKLRLATRRGISLRGRTIGVVGCGNIGLIVAERAPALGLQVLRNDPPLAAAAEASGDEHSYVSLERLLGEADIITLHVPLTVGGPHGTRHLIGEDELTQMSADAWLINTSRGAVVDNRALEEALKDGSIGGAVLDVWEGEPTPSAQLIELVDLATPHIAGYSLDGKVRGTEMLYRAVVEWLDVSRKWSAEAILQPVPPPVLQLPPDDSSLEAQIDALVRQIYNIEEDDTNFRPTANLSSQERGEAFVALRKHYRLRRSFTRYRLPESGIARDVRQVFEGLRGNPAGASKG